jgi:predicted HTH transcriptional regulator
MSFASVKQILDDHAYNSLIGLAEDTWLDAKRVPGYDLETPGGRYELAKDVSAFANNSGGFIVVGLDTQVDQNQQTETITALSPFAAENFQAHRYQAIIEEHVHPHIESLRIYWVQIAQEPALGLGIIEIPPQNPDRQYFLVAKVVDSGATIRQIVFGIAVRNDSSNEPFTRDQLYRYTQNGKSSVAQKITRIDEKLDALMLRAQDIPHDVDPESQYVTRTAEILNEDE